MEIACALAIIEIEEQSSISRMLTTVGARQNVGLQLGEEMNSVILLFWGIIFSSLCMSKAFSTGTLLR